MNDLFEIAVSWTQTPIMVNQYWFTYSGNQPLHGTGLTQVLQRRVALLGHNVLMNPAAI